LDGKDFIIADILHANCGRYVNLNDLQQGGVGRVHIRYANLRRVMCVTVPEAHADTGRARTDGKEDPVGAA